MGIIEDFIQAFRVKHDTIVSDGLKLQVVENDKLKMFKLDDATHSIINKRSVYTHGYWDYLLPIFYTYKNPRVLMIGLGMGTTAYQLRKLFGKRIRLEIVDNNAAVVNFSRKHSPNLKKERIIVADGLAYLEESARKYDVIVLDAYGKGARIPKQFLKDRFAHAARGALKKKGVLAINYAMNPIGIIRYGSYRKVLKRLFKAYSVKTDVLGDTLILLCSSSREKDELLEKMRSKMRINRANSALLEAYEQMKSL